MGNGLSQLGLRGRSFQSLSWGQMLIFRVLYCRSFADCLCQALFWSSYRPRSVSSLYQYCFTLIWVSLRLPKCHTASKIKWCGRNNLENVLKLKEHEVSIFSAKWTATLTTKWKGNSNLVVLLNCKFSARPISKHTIVSKWTLHNKVALPDHWLLWSLLGLHSHVPFCRPTCKHRARFPLVDFVVSFTVLSIPDWTCFCYSNDIQKDVKFIRAHLPKCYFQSILESICKRTLLPAWLLRHRLEEHFAINQQICMESILNFHEVPVGQTWRRNKMASSQSKSCTQKN